MSRTLRDWVLHFFPDAKDSLTEESNQQKDVLVDFLHQALDHNPKCMLQVLECVAAASKSSFLSSSLSPREFLCDLLPQALEVDLPWLIGALLWLSPTPSSPEPWESHALEAIRSEVALLIQETPNPMPPFYWIGMLLFQRASTLPVVTAPPSDSTTTTTHFFSEYLQHVLWQAKESETSTPMTTTTTTTDSSPPHTWNLLDIMVALVARVPIPPKDKGIMEDNSVELCHPVLDAAVLAAPSLLESLVDLVKYTLQQREEQQRVAVPSYLPTPDYDAFREWLQRSMVWLTIHWTMSNNSSLPLHGRTLGLALVALEDESLSTQLLRALCSVYRDVWYVVQHPSRLSIKKSNLQQTMDTAIRVLTTTNDILLHILRSSSSIQAPITLGDQLLKFLQSDQVTLPTSVVQSMVACVVELYKNQPEELSRCCSTLLVGGNFLPEEPDSSVLVDPVEVRGLLFLQTWLTHTNSTLDTSHYTLAWKWVRSILLPTSLKRRRFVSPAIGCPCLDLLRVMWNRRHPSRDSSARSLQSIQDLFLPALTTVLSSTRLVRYIDLSADAPPTTHTWGYQHVPEELQTPSSSASSSNKKQMLFSFSTTLDECPPTQLEDTCRWMFQLLDTYLWLGRGRPEAPKNWKPHPWVYAFLEIPNLSFSSPQWDSVAHIFEEFDVNELQSSRNSKTQELVEMVRHSASSRQGRAQIMDRVIEYSYVLALGLAVSVALLKNTYQRYAATATTGEMEHALSLFPSDAMPLVQYQLAKVFHLRQKCQIMTKFLHRMDALEVSNAKKRKRSQSSTQDAGTVADQMSSTLSFLDESITSNIIGQCALDPSLDSMLVNSVRTLISEEVSIPETTNLAWELRLCGLGILENKLRMVGLQDEHYKTSHSLEHDLLILQSKLESFAGLSFQLLNILEQRDRQNVSPTRFHRMVNSYFQILQQILVANLQPPASSKPSSRPRKTFSRFLSLYISANNVKTKASTSRNEFTQLHNVFKHHLDSFQEVNIAVTLMETLSVFAVLAPIPVDHSKILETSWSTLQTTDNAAQYYSGTGTPFALQRVLHQIQSSSGINREKTALELVSKLSNRVRQPGSQSWLVHCMLRHWGLSIVLSPSMKALAQHWSSLWLNLLQYLERIKMLPTHRHADVNSDQDEDDDTNTDKPDDQSTRKSSTTTTNTNTLEEKSAENPSDEEEEEYLPPSHVDSDSEQLPLSVDRDDVELPSTDAPWLSRDHLALHIQLALDLTVATAAMVRLEAGTRWVPRNTSPYQSFLELAMTFGKLIRLVPACWSWFPSPLVVATSCRSMVGLVDGICRDCRTWRNAQGVVPESGRHDPASVHYFHSLLVGLEQEIVEPILELCQQLGLTRGYAVGTSTWKWLQKRTTKVASMLETQKQAHAVSSPTTTTLMTMMDTPEISITSVPEHHTIGTTTGTFATPNVLTSRRKTSQRRETLRRVELTSLPSLPARSPPWAALSDTLAAPPPPVETNPDSMDLDDDDSGESDYFFHEEDDEDNEDEDDSFDVQGDWGKGDTESVGEELQEE